MTIAISAIVLGLLLLVWSADRFVEGAASTARYFGAPPLLIGMVVVGFGTSVPEMVVSAISSFQGNPGIALGNAYGSNITNIALILGLTALISPIAVHSQVLRKELPILAAATVLTVCLLWDNELSRGDAMVLLLVFAGLIAWTIGQGLKKSDTFGKEVEQGMETRQIPIRRAVFWLILGLILLVGSSRLLVYGAVEIAQGLGIRDLIIGLTIVAVGTSLPEMASSIIATRKGEHDIALGNVIGSNLFNTLAVVGIAGGINPMSIGRDILTRDVFVMALLTIGLFAICYGFRGPGRINRYEGAFLLVCYIAYTVYLITGALG